MKNDRYNLESLPWLPRAGADFRMRSAALTNLPTEEVGPALESLAAQYLDTNQLTRLARVKRQVQTAGRIPHLANFRLGLVSNSTTTFIEPCLEASALRYGLALDVIASDFDQSTQEALDPESRLNRAAPDAILVALDYRGVGFVANRPWDDPEALDHRGAIDRLERIRDGFRRVCGAPCIFQTLPAPHGLLFGSLDLGTSGTLRSVIERFNSALALRLSDGPDMLLDVSWLASAVGLQRWYDERQWFWGRLPFSQGLVPLYADFVSRLLAAVRGKSRKCLVLDLDNTLWGGVVGDDGVDGLALSEGDPRGEAYRAVQAMAHQLKERGILLAVCSKNDDETARAPFRSHPGMLLKEDDIALFIANWNDKPANLRAISERLSIGLDSLVLLDDNPAERALVRQTLPMVAVPELGSDPSLFVQTVLSAGYFEAIGFSKEDRLRAAQYRANAEREKIQAVALDMPSFLRGLEMVIQFRPFDSSGRKRIAQLINKTNQFNLTTRRYSEHQVMEMEARPEVFTLQVALRDKFGDNGMIAVLILVEETPAWEVDTWLMSCRVFNRRVEECICNHIVEAAAQRGIERIRGTYIPTPKNGIVRGLYQKLGFQKVCEDGQQEIWQLELSRYVPFDVPFHVAL